MTTPADTASVGSGDDGLWVFGYGSLIWRTGFHYAASRPAYIRDWSRRFWQGSTDHRGVPGAPGRVVTLVADAGSTCWGMAYRLDPEQQAEVMAQLDHREQGGYERLQLPLHFSATEAVTGITYHATESNSEYLGEAGISEIARQVLAARGPSGSNLDYVLHLERALRELGQPDPHVTELAEALRKAMERAALAGR